MSRMIETLPYVPSTLFVRMCVESCYSTFTVPGGSEGTGVWYGPPTDCLSPKVLEVSVDAVIIGQPNCHLDTGRIVPSHPLYYIVFCASCLFGAGLVGGTQATDPIVDTRNLALAASTLWPLRSIALTFALPPSPS